MRFLYKDVGSSYIIEPISLFLGLQGRLPSSGGEGQRAGGREGSHRGGGPGRGLSGCDGHHEGLRQKTKLYLAKKKID